MITPHPYVFCKCSFCNYFKSFVFVSVHSKSSYRGILRKCSF